MTRKRGRSPATTGFDVVGLTGALDHMVSGGFQPVLSRWTWHAVLPELWLRVQEGRQFRAMTDKSEKED